jgi:hypothetical protein
VPIVEWNRQRTETQQLAEKYSLENQITRGEVLRRTELAKGLALIAEAISARVMSCTESPRRAREDILPDLASWPLALEEVAHAQTQLRNGKGSRAKARDVSLR